MFERIILMGLVYERSFINGTWRAETSVLMEQLDTLMIRIGMKNLSVENFKMVFGVRKMNHLEREKWSVLYFYRKMGSQYESPLGVLPETIKKMWSELREGDRRLCHRYRINNADRRTRNVW